MKKERDQLAAYARQIVRRLRETKDHPDMRAQEDDPVEVWSEFCRRAEDAVASASDEERPRVMDVWADTMMQLSRQLAGVACPKCHGAGTRRYGSTATWRGGMGGASITTDICDACRGTGRSDRSGLDRRKLEAQMRAAQRESSLRWFSNRIGVNLSVMRKAFPGVAEKLRRARWKEYHENRAAKIIAHALDDMSQKSPEPERPEDPASEPLVVWEETLADVRRNIRENTWVGVRLPGRVEIRRIDGSVTLLLYVIEDRVSISSNARFDLTHETTAEIADVVAEALKRLREGPQKR